MTLLEILDDAVKIGLGSVTGWLIARGSRSHDFEKERRRRRQDLIERSLDGFESAHAKFEILGREFASYCESEEPVKNESFWPPMKLAMEAARDKLETLNTIEGRFTMLGLSKSAMAIERYREAARAMALSVRFTKQPPNENREVFRAAEADWERNRLSVENQIAADYSRL